MPLSIIFTLYLFGFYSFLDADTNAKENEYKLVWSDEFTNDGKPNKNNWSYEIGDACNLPCGCGWGNNEKQFYKKSKKNARVKNGKLIIEAHKKEKKLIPKYTSARLISKGKINKKFGKIESRIKLPKGKGIWSAFWMMPENEKYGFWPKSGEIDIMEFVGFESDSIYGTVHTAAFNHIKGTHKGANIYVENLEDEWHNYSIEWTNNKIDFFVDENIYFTFNNENKTTAEWPFNQPFYIIFNLAIGGNWGGRFGIDDSIFPQKMEIDYVRIYEKQN